jgi:hypothetical protein
LAIKPQASQRLVGDEMMKRRHDGCGGLPSRAELLTGIEGVSTDRCEG